MDYRPSAAYAWWCTGYLKPRFFIRVLRFPFTYGNLLFHYIGRRLHGD